MPRVAQRGFALLAAIAAAAVAAGAAAPGTSPPRFLGATLAHPAPAPDFALRDQHGHVLRVSTWRGNVVLITFLYTHCPDVCPLTASNLNVSLRILGSVRRRVVVLAISVDPRRDTPAAVTAFIRRHGLLPQFHYLTGSASDLERVWSAYRVTAVRRSDKGVDHTLYTLLVDPSGVGRVIFDASASARAIAHDVRLLLRS